MKTFKNYLAENEEEHLGSSDPTIFMTRNYLDHKNLLEQGDKLHEHKGLSEKETGIVDRYTGGLYANLNRHHRGNEKLFHDHQDPLQHIPEYLDTQSKHLDSAIAKHTIQHPAHVWRGIPRDHVESLNLKAGDIMHDKGYVSTSLNPLVADNFHKSAATEEQGGAHVFHIKLPKGSKAIYPNKYPNTKSLEGEHEVILPRNSKFRYEGSEEHKRVNSWGNKIKYTIHHLTHIPE